MNHFIIFATLYYSFAGIAQLVEHQLPKLRAAGSNPVSRSNNKKAVITAFLLFTQTDPDSSGGGMCK
jgi:hypothetical protein